MGLIMDNDIKVEWKSVRGYEGIYEINNLGVVRSLNRVNHCGTLIKGKILSQHSNRGYMRVELRKTCIRKSFYVHRILADLFIPHVTGKYYVNHMNGIKNDNRLSNLEWVTHKENMIHAYDNKLATGAIGELSNTAKLKSTDITTILDSTSTNAELAVAYGVQRNTIRSVRIGKTWKKEYSIWKDFRNGK